MPARDEAQLVSTTSSTALIGLGVLLLGGLCAWAGSASHPWMLFLPKAQWLYLYLPYPMLLLGLLSLVAGVAMAVVVSQHPSRQGP